MAEYQKKEGEIAVFPNEGANESNKWPTHKGSLYLDGKNYDVALWGKTSKNGVSFQSGFAKPKDESYKKGGQGSAPSKQKTSVQEVEDLPF